jgi:type IV secretory pathway TrbD component
MMALVEKPDPRKKLMLAGALDAIVILTGVGLFVTTGSMMWFIGAVIAGAIISAPLILSAIRELKEQSNASR